MGSESKKHAGGWRRLTERAGARVSAGAGAALKAKAERQACTELGCRAGCAEQGGALERRRGAGVGQRRAGPRPSKQESGGEKRLGRQAAGQARKGKGEEGWAKSGVGLKMRKGIFFKYKSFFSISNFKTNLNMNQIMYKYDLKYTF